MKKIFAVIIILLTVAGCKSRIKEQKDSLYSRHLQRHVELKIVTTPMPDNKEEMNLLVLANGDMYDDLRIKKNLDSLYKHKAIQPLTVICVKSNMSDFGSALTGGNAAKEHQQFDDFISDELYPFAKKKMVIRKFNSVAVCGFGDAALNAFDISWNNDEKFVRSGMFFPQMNDEDLEAISSSRKRPNVSIWMTAEEKDSASVKLKAMMDTKKTVTECKLVTVPSSGNKKIPQNNFAEFLTWAFPK